MTPITASPMMLISTPGMPAWAWIPKSHRVAPIPKTMKFLVFACGFRANRLNDHRVMIAPAISSPIALPFTGWVSYLLCFLLQRVAHVVFLDKIIVNTVCSINRKTNQQKATGATSSSTNATLGGNSAAFNLKPAPKPRPASRKSST